MTLDALFPPPFEVQQRAWECALVLVSDYQGRLDAGEAAFCALALGPPAERLGWRQIRYLFRLHRTVAGQRV